MIRTRVSRYAPRALALCCAAWMGVTVVERLPAQKRVLTASAKTAHFRIFYRPGSRAGAAVDRVAVLAERELARICSQLGVEIGGSLKLYLYDDLEELARVTGVKGTGGYSAGDASHIPFDNDQTRYHEMVHIVAFNLLPKVGKEKRNLFFAEGLANACLEFVHGVPVHAVAKYYRSKGVLPSLQEMTGPLDFYAWLRARAGFNAYDVAGSYMRFLLDRYGPARTTRFYTGVSAKSAFGVRETELETQWHGALDQFVMRPELAELLHERHKGSVAQLEARARPAGLPKDILGKASEWRSLVGEKLVPDGGARWRRQGRAIIGTSKAAKWSVCELGTKTYGDCVVRATIETSAPVRIRSALAKATRGCWSMARFSTEPASPSPAVRSRGWTATARARTSSWCAARVRSRYGSMAARH